VIMKWIEKKIQRYTWQVCEWSYLSK